PRDRRRFPEQLKGFFARISGALSGIAFRAFDELHVDWHFGFHYVDAVVFFREFLHAPDHALGFAFRVLQTFFIPTLRIVSNEFKEVRNVLPATLVANAFNESMLLVVDLFGVEWRVIDKDLDAIRAGFF